MFIPPLSFYCLWRQVVPVGVIKDDMYFNTLLFNVGGTSNTLGFDVGGTSNTLLFSVGGTSNTLLFSVGGASNTLGFMRYTNLVDNLI